MIRNLLVLFLLVLLSASPALAQKSITRSSKTEVINGKKYYLHRVEKKETLYSLSKAYEVTANDIVVENPEAIDGLKPGMILKIPVKESKDNTVKNPVNPAIYSGPTHVVQKGETMYSLCKKYNVTPEQLMNLNPELKDGVKLGMLVKLPDKFVKPRDAQGTVSAQDTAKFVKDTSDLRIAFLLPFYTALNTDEKEYKDINEKNIICPKSDIGVSFYQGAMMALDSLRKMGLHLNVHSYDTENDSAMVEQIIAKPELKEMDLIIGPLYSSNFKRVSDFAKKNQISMVAPFSQVNKILLGNPYIYKATPSVSSQVEELACYVSANGKGKELILLNSDNFRDKNFYDLFRKRYNSLGGDSIKEINYKKDGLSAIESAAKGEKEVWVLALSNDQVFVTELLNKLTVFRSDKIRLFGPESWMGFDNLDPEYLMKLHVTLCLPQYLDYNDPLVKAYVRSYREKFRTDPDRYSFQGFDVTWYFASLLKEYGRNFSSAPIKPGKGFQNSFNFVKTAVESGYENKSTNIVEYREYKLERLRQ